MTTTGADIIGQALAQGGATHAFGIPGGEVLADLVGAGASYVVARGGRGGLGNAALSSPRRRAPGFALLGNRAGDHRHAMAAGQARHHGQ